MKDISLHAYTDDQTYFTLLNIYAPNTPNINFSSLY